jgi:uncharacterized protein (TIGR03000 family)
MYTVVLMMAMTGGSETTTFGGRRCNGGGCNGGCVASCSRGCNGGGCHGGGRVFGRGGCHGGGGCHGCSASVGCHGGCSAYRGGNGGGYVVVEPRRYNAEEQSETGPRPLENRIQNGSAPATIIINLPAEARLTVDGEATTSTSGRRVFLSPPLAQGSEYYYTINAEIMRNGQPVAVTRRVPVTPGRETRITLDFDRDVTPARGEERNDQPKTQPNRESPNNPAPNPSLERPKNNREPQPNP